MRTIRLKGESCVCAAMVCNCEDLAGQTCGDCTEYSLDDLPALLASAKASRGGHGLYKLRLARMVALYLGNGVCDGVCLVLRDGRAVPVADGG